MERSAHNVLHVVASAGTGWYRTNEISGVLICPQSVALSTRPPYSQMLFKSNLHIVLNISCKFHSCVKTLSHKTTEPSCGSLISLYNHVYGEGARGGRRQHKGELTGAGGTLDGVSSPHGAFSKVAGKSFSVLNRFGPNLVHLLGVPEEDRPPTLKKIRQL